MLQKTESTLSRDQHPLTSNPFQKAYPRCPENLLLLHFLHRRSYRHSKSSACQFEEADEKGSQGERTMMLLKLGASIRENLDRQ
jgi:hypothetical protein